MKMESSHCNYIIRALVLIFIIGITFTETQAVKAADSITEEQESETQKHGIVGIEVAEPDNPIDNFSYSISGSEVILNSYNGENSVLEIQPTYNIDGVDYTTNLSDFLIRSNSVNTFILDEGISEIKDNIFNSSKVKKVFFPKSMTVVYDKALTYLHPDDGELIQIYYGGTQEEWSNIFKAYVRESFSDAEGAAAKGTALADMLNDFIGVEYDSSEFEYFFSATPEDLK